MRYKFKGTRLSTTLRTRLVFSMAMHFLPFPYVCYCLISLIFTILVVMLFSLVFYLLQPVAQKCLKNVDAILSYYWEIPVFIMFWIKFCTMVKHWAVTSVLEVSGALTTDLDCVRLTLLLICQQNDSFDSCLWNGFLEGVLRINPNNIIAVFFSFFPRFYSIMQFKKNSLPDERILR